jgi:hypothetical protein
MLGNIRFTRIISATLWLHVERWIAMVKQVGADVQCLNAINNTTMLWLCLTKLFLIFVFSNLTVKHNFPYNE